ncbi:AAA family ATPase [Sorangium sp. So ce131]|uniref:AAA family ATPase n=1 Tax=Sorangium sp. So ce131 TaxID=3133282 RepID=UPI003F60E665
MLLRDLKLRHLKRIEALDLDFKNADGSPRSWTVIIGRNGTAKTTILQAIALAAAGGFRANALVEDIRESLPDKRCPGEPATIEADFTFGPIGQRPDNHPLLDENERARLCAPRYERWLRSHVEIRTNALLVGHSKYVDRSDHGPLDGRGVPEDPLMAAREENRSLWFVAAYGVDRRLPQVARAPFRPPHPPTDRLWPIFRPSQLIGLNFEEVLDERLSQKYASLLKAVLFRTEDLVPGIVGLELRGRRARTPSDLMISPRFMQKMGDKEKELKLPATWLSHGYQSVLAWVSDLVGQITLEAGSRVEPKDMEGLVLIDEVDLYLHPSWQVGLVQALRETFPQMQFVVTTHSPILLTAFRREEVVVLDFDEQGNVVRSDTPRDPRLMTATELYEWFFGINKLYPSELGDKLDTYNRIAANPFRTNEEDALAPVLRKELESEGITPGVPLSPRRRATGT